MKLSDKGYHRKLCDCVAPLAGAWIEIFKVDDLNNPALSLPSRERGLKLTSDFANIERKMSLPSRERGLKYTQKKQLYNDVRSLPSRERGLK